MGTECGMLTLLCYAIVLYQIFRSLYRLIVVEYLKPKLGYGVDVRAMGQWAVVTGATDGIGKAFAYELARKKMNVALLSRTQSKLDEVAKNIEEKYGVETKTIAVDFSKTDIYHTIEKQLQDLDIGVLVNNVGMSYSYPQYFLEVANEKFISDILNINVVSVLNMCRIFLPIMIEKKRGVILNVSSAAAELPSTLLNAYSSAKLMVDKFTQELAYEYKDKGVVIQSVLPYFVATKMAKLRKPSFWAPSPDQYARATLKRIGICNHTNGYFPHSLINTLTKVLGAICYPLFQRVVFNAMLKTRRRYMNRKK